MFEKYEYEAIFAASKGGLPVSTYVKTESVAAMVDNDNIFLDSLRIIWNYIRDPFGDPAIFPVETVHTLGTGYMEVEYGTYEYEKENDMEKEGINFWYRQYDFLLVFEISCMICK